ncbi:MAG: VCBS repeat-containing protein, partial [Planctomycetaceae bacterium]|nr:VCBS repeat-containing protein [Planctomycetaceae bacterium]
MLCTWVCLWVSGCQTESVEKEQQASQEATRQASSGAPADGIRPEFEDIWPEQKLDFVYRNGRDANELAILETLGGGTAILDYDRDGRLDLFYTGGGTFENKTTRGYPSILLRHTGQLKFQDRTAQAGMGLAAFYSNGCSAGDYDNDGFQDLIVTGYGGSILWRNMGDGTFEETSIDAGLRNCFWGSSAGWGDLNGDGLLDLYVAKSASQTNLFYKNWGYNFQRLTDNPTVQTASSSFSGTWVDYDGDFDQDLFVTNSDRANQLFENQGNGTFVEITSGALVTDQGYSQGASWGDYDNDGDL